MQHTSFASRSSIMRGLVLLLLLVAAAVGPKQTSARLLGPETTALSPLDTLAALLTQLPPEQLSLGVSEADFFSVLHMALEATEGMTVKGTVDMRPALYSLALDVASKVLLGSEGSAEQLLQGLNTTYVMKYPSALPNLTAAFPNFKITDFPTNPWLNRSITIKGFLTFKALNSSLSVLVPQLAILNSKLILNNSFTQATLQVLNATLNNKPA